PQFRNNDLQQQHKDVERMINFNRLFIEEMCRGINADIQGIKQLKEQAEAKEKGQAADEASITQQNCFLEVLTCYQQTLGTVQRFADFMQQNARSQTEINTQEIKPDDLFQKMNEELSSTCATLYTNFYGDANFNTHTSKFVMGGSVVGVLLAGVLIAGFATGF